MIAGMDNATAIVLATAFFATALLYASVGQAGASGYLAAMALFSVAPEVMRPTALVLNVLVAGIASYKFWRVGAFSWSLFLPFALTSVPLAFVGGVITLPGSAYKIAVGLVLLYAALRMFGSTRGSNLPAVRPPPLLPALISGAGIGLLSGLTGTGGGIFLTPLLLFAGWAEARQASAVSAVFILVNSVSGLLGQTASFAALPGVLPLWLVVAAVGGWIGAEMGSRRLGGDQVRRALAVVMAIAAFKMMLT